MQPTGFLATFFHGESRRSFHRGPYLPRLAAALTCGGASSLLLKNATLNRGVHRTLPCGIHQNGYVLRGPRRCKSQRETKPSPALPGAGICYDDYPSHCWRDSRTRKLCAAMMERAHTTNSCFDFLHRIGWRPVGRGRWVAPLIRIFPYYYTCISDAKRLAVLVLRRRRTRRNL